MDIDFETKFSNVLGSINLTQLKKTVILQTDNGCYELYGQYIIKKINKNHYAVYKEKTHTHEEFFNLKNSVAWCYFDIFNRLYDASRIKDLDRKLTSLSAEIKIQESILNKTTEIEKKNIFYTKITENKLIYKAVTKELLKYAHKAMDYNLSLLEQIKTKETR
jgi:hypothetical protein